MKTLQKNVVTEQQIYNYIDCPVRYSIIYESSIPTAKTMTVPVLIEPIAASFFLELMNGRVRSTDWLKQKWDVVCKKYPGYLNSNRIIRGIALLVNLFQYCKRKETQVVDINSPFEVFTNKTIVKGTLGVISPYKDKFELLALDFNQKTPDQTLIDMDLKYTMDCMAFRTLYLKEIAGIRVVHVRTGHEYMTYRTRDDFTRLENIVDSVSRAIQQKIYYPRRNVLCPQCPEKNLCKGWVC